MRQGPAVAGGVAVPETVPRSPIAGATGHRRSPADAIAVGRNLFRCEKPCMGGIVVKPTTESGESSGLEGPDDGSKRPVSAATGAARTLHPGSGLSGRRRTSPIPGPTRPTPPDFRRTSGTRPAVPVGVRLELVGDAQAIDIAYRTTSGNLGYRGDGAGITFSVWRGGRKVCEEEAVLGDGLIRLSLGSAAPDKPAIIYLPEGMQPVVLSLTAVKGEIAPAPAAPPVARLRGLGHPGLDRLGPVPGLGGHRRPEDRVGPGQPGLRRRRSRRDRLRRAHRRPDRRHHHHRLRGELLDPGPAQRGHGRRGIPGLPRRGPRRATRRHRSWWSARSSDPTPRTCPTSSAPRWPTSATPSSR